MRTKNFGVTFWLLKYSKNFEELKAHINPVVWSPAQLG